MSFVLVPPKTSSLHIFDTYTDINIERYIWQPSIKFQIIFIIYTPILVYYVFARYMEIRYNRARLLRVHCRIWSTIIPIWKSCFVRLGLVFEYIYIIFFFLTFTFFLLVCRRILYKHAPDYVFGDRYAKFYKKSRPGKNIMHIIRYFVFRKITIIVII